MIQTKPPRYKIKLSIKWDEKYIILKRKKFLFWYYYRTVDQEVCGWESTYSIPYRFNTEMEASAFVGKLERKERRQDRIVKQMY